MSVISAQKITIRYVEMLLRSYPQISREVMRLRESIRFPYVEEEQSDGGKGNLPGDPTGKMAVKMAEHSKLIHCEKVKHAIEKMYNALSEPKQELVRVAYWTNPQRLTTIGICEELNISERTFWRWRKQILREVTEILGMH